ncbi:RNA-binding protein Nova-1-like [Anneissia japonica]|uniref:RNA-binding protein Nova-1-like n=1 Tax=Anneissia japonica TaxID=1529436 RepID=UPI0014256440|nr:RNA-binding protein Nova-1-like [Anneissia japonica]
MAMDFRPPMAPVLPSSPVIVPHSVAVAMPPPGAIALSNMGHEQIVVMNGDSSLDCNRKRPLEDDIQLNSSKRLNYSGDDSKCVLKMLIPSTAAGSIIGKGGQTIAQLQRDTGSNIKLSKANDFYPGTTERVTLITGTEDAINTVSTFFIEKIKESPQLGAQTGAENVTSPERARQVKVVVPNSTAGLIIGKGGTMIKSIMEQSSARVQISQKSEGITLSERVITISGELDSVKKAMSFVVSKIQEDPQSGSCNNLSYAAITGPVANANPTGSPFAETNSVVQTIAKSPLGIPTTPGLPGLPVGGMALTPQAVFGARVPQAPSPLSAHHGITAAEHGLGIPMGHLAQYGYSLCHNVSALPGMGIGATSPLLGATAHAIAQPSAPVFPPSSMSASSFLGGHYQLAASSAPSPPKPTPAIPITSTAVVENTPNGTPGHAVSMGSEALVPGFAMAHAPSYPGVGVTFAPEQIKEATKECALEFEVPETIVGAILGKGGKTLVEFQQYSGAKIQISKKGEYVPGTRNRKVTITGSPSATQTAHFLVSQRIFQEEQNRALKGTT